MAEPVSKRMSLEEFLGWDDGTDQALNATIAG
jgi:hypothetical protein